MAGFHPCPHFRPCAARAMRTPASFVAAGPAAARVVRGPQQEVSGPEYGGADRDPGMGRRRRGGISRARGRHYRRSWYRTADLPRTLAENLERSARRGCGRIARRRAELDAGGREPAPCRAFQAAAPIAHRASGAWVRGEGRLGNRRVLPFAQACLTT